MPLHSYNERGIVDPCRPTVPLLGLDIGTSNNLVASYGTGLLLDADGHQAMPSAVTLVKVDNRIRMVCGSAALRLIARGHQGIINPKRIISVAGSQADTERLGSSITNTVNSFNCDSSGRITVGIKGG